MHYTLNPNKPSNVQAMKYFSDYFAAKLERPEDFDPSQLRVYAENPQRGGEAPEQLSGDDLRSHMKLSKPVFVAYGKKNSEVVPFMENKGVIYSGKELTELADSLQTEAPTKPAEVPAPGGFAKFLSFFGIKLESVRAYENYQKVLGYYTRNMEAHEQTQKNLRSASRLSADVDEEYLSEDIKKIRQARAKKALGQSVKTEDPKAEEAAIDPNAPKAKNAAIDPNAIKATLENDQLQIGDAAPQDAVPDAKKLNAVKQKEAKEAEEKRTRANDCKLIADTIVDRMMEEEMQKPGGGMDRETVDHMVRYGAAMRKLVGKSNDVSAEYARMAVEDPEKLMEAFKLSVKAVQKKDEAAKKQAQDVKKTQPEQPQIKAPGKH